jgi:DUF1680 family protein
MFAYLSLRLCGSLSLSLATVLLCLSGLANAQGPTQGLRTPAFTPLPLGAVKPSGWLKGQLRIQADGLSGHLDEFWPDIKDSAWTGGKAEGWERAPYWLDGLVPLAYLLDDQALKTKAKKFIDYVLDHEADDGWLGPLGDNDPGHKPYDPWPLFVLFKALTQYQEASGDPRIVPSLLKCAHKIDEVTNHTPLYSWAKFRWADLVVTLFWLYDRTDEPWLLALADTMHQQGHDWRAQFENFRFTGKTQGKFELDTHGVNTAMALKTAGLWYRRSRDEKDRQAVFHMLEELDRHHGQATGIFSCDEHLAGRSPSQGTELCTVVEAMYSLELLTGILGETALADRLEKLAFNALPATFKKDMTAHQYDQQCNQVVCRVAKDHVYVDNGPDANLYGLEPNFGCCTANMHQGWPKFAAHLWMSSADRGLAALAYAPCLVRTKVAGKTVRLEVKTDYGYPFPGGREGTRVVVRVEPEAEVRFPLHLRVPTWAAGAQCSVDGQALPNVEPGKFLVVDRTWSGREPTEVTLRLPMRVRLREGYNGAISIERGPLVFALRIGAEWKKIKDRPGLPFDDWEVHPNTPWNYALFVDREHPENSFQVETRHMSDHPFSLEEAPIQLKVKGRRVPSWTLKHSAAAPPPVSPVSSTEPLEELTLVPYGCTDLRVTEFPTLPGANPRRDQ